MSEALIVALISLVCAIVAIIVPLLKKPHETKKLDAETTKLYTESMENAQHTFMARIENLEKRVSFLEEENDLLRDWAERLVFQVKSLGAEPVKMKLKPVKINKA